VLIIRYDSSYKNYLLLLYHSFSTILDIMNEKIKRDRKPNFSDEEVRYLLEGILEEKVLIQSKLQSSVTMRKKKEAWHRIIAAVNARSNGVIRTEEECRKKWKDVKSAALKSKNEQKRTGGGGPVKQCVHDDVVFAIIGDSTVVDGIEGMLINFCFTLYSLSLCLSLSLIN